jgi:hypothetical protein
MPRPVKLDRQPFGRAIKIKYVPPNTMLPPKFAPIKI